MAATLRPVTALNCTALRCTVAACPSVALRPAASAAAPATATAAVTCTLLIVRRVGRSNRMTISRACSSSAAMQQQDQHSATNGSSPLTAAHCGSRTAIRWLLLLLLSIFTLASAPTGECTRYVSRRRLPWRGTTLRAVGCGRSLLSLLCAIGTLLPMSQHRHLPSPNISAAIPTGPTRPRARCRWCRSSHPRQPWPAVCRCAPRRGWNTLG